MSRKLLVVLFGVVAVVARAAVASAQAPASDTWKIAVVPYFAGAGISGTTTVAGQEVEIDASFSDILENLQFGAMGLVVARKGNWGAGGDSIWFALGANATSAPASVDVNQGAFAFYGLRRLSPAADLTFGGRVNVVQANIRVTGPAAVRSADGSKTWFDPLVGLTLHTPEGEKRWHAQLYSEIGGFGMGSTFAWQLFPTVGVNVGRHASLEFGWRWLGMDYETGENLTFFKYDALMEGPVMGVGFRF